MTAPLRLLAFIADLDGGGAQRTMVNLLNRLPGERFAATLAAPRTNGPAAAWLAPHVEVVDLACRRLRGAVGPLRALLRGRRPAVLFSTMLDANITAAAACFGLAPAPALVLRETNSQRARDDLG